MMRAQNEVRARLSSRASIFFRLPRHARARCTAATSLHCSRLICPLHLLQLPLRSHREQGQRRQQEEFKDGGRRAPRRHLRRRRHVALRPAGSFAFGIPDHHHGFSGQKYGRRARASRTRACRVRASRAASGGADGGRKSPRRHRRRRRHFAPRPAGSFVPGSSSRGPATRGCRGSRGDM